MIDQTKCHGVMCPNRHKCQRHQDTHGAVSPATEALDGQRKIMMGTCTKDDKWPLFVATTGDKK